MTALAAAIQRSSFRSLSCELLAALYLALRVFQIDVLIALGSVLLVGEQTWNLVGNFAVEDLLSVGGSLGNMVSLSDELSF